MSEHPPLSIEDLSCSYASTRVVEGLSLSIEAGELVAVLGASGSGKSTLLRAVAGFVTPVRGSIRVHGELVVEAGRERICAERRRVGMVFQDYALFAHMSVRENIAFGIHAWGQAERRARVEGLLGLIGLPELGARRPAELSGGQQQRVALARALASRPRLLLLDEPFANLDAALRHELSDGILDILREEGVSAMLVTHDRSEALGMADKVAVLGRVEGEGCARLRQLDAPEAVYRRPADAHVAALTGTAIFLDGEAVGESARTVLGEVRLGRSAQGPVQIVLRPEQLRFEVSEGGSAEVLTRRFLGARTHVRLKTPAGVLPMDCATAPEAGSRGRVVVEGVGWPL